MIAIDDKELHHSFNMYLGKKVIHLVSAWASVWEKLTSLVRIRRERRLADKVQVEVRCYIASLPPNANKLLQAIRAHWGIEYSVYWILDVAFNKDQGRVRKNHAPENLPVIRRIAIYLLRKEKTAKGDIQAKRLQYGWDERYFLKVIS